MPPFNFFLITFFGTIVLLTATTMATAIKYNSQSERKVKAANRPAEERLFWGVYRRTLVTYAGHTSVFEDTLYHLHKPIPDRSGTEVLHQLCGRIKSLGKPLPVEPQIDKLCPDCLVRLPLQAIIGRIKAGDNEGGREALRDYLDEHNSVLEGWLWLALLTVGKEREMCLSRAAQLDRCFRKMAGQRLTHVSDAHLAVFLKYDVPEDLVRLVPLPYAFSELSQSGLLH